MRNFAQQSKQFNERKITRRQEDFSAGVYNDIAASKVPNNGLYYSENYEVHPDRLQGRAGNKRHTNTPLPSLPGRTGYSLTKTGTTVTKTVGVNFTAADVGNYVVYDDGDHERIDTFVDANNVTVEETTAHVASTVAFIRGPVNLIKQHDATRKVILHIDTRIFIADNADITAWNEAVNVGFDSPLATISTFDERDNFAFVFNANRTYKINLDSNPILYFAINSPIPTVLPTGNTQTAALPFQRKVLYRMARLSGSGYDRQQNTPGIVREQISGPNAVDTNFKDFGEFFTSRPVGDGSTTFGVLTGGILQSPYDVVAGWTPISDGQFRITINGTSKNITVDFSGATSMTGVAEIIQLALRDFFSGVTAVFVTDHFVITEPSEGGTITVTSAGDAGTDIGSSIMETESGTGTVSNPAFTAALIVGTLTIPVDSGTGTPQFHWTHFQIFTTLDIGVNGINPITGEGNNSELFIHNLDVPVARPVIASRSGSTVTATAGTFNAADVGDTITFQNLTTAVIATFISTTQVTTTTSGAIASQAAALGKGSVLTAGQTGTTVTRVSGHAFVSGDVGKTIFFTTGQVAFISAFIDGSTVTAFPSQTIGSTGATFDPISRTISTTVRDRDLRTRIAGFSLENRFWVPLPDADIGAIVNAFMFVAVRGEHRLYYSQMPAGQQYLGGYYNETYQTTSFSDTIQHLSEFPDRLIIYASHSTHGVPINTFDSVTIPNVGEFIAVLAGQNVIDHNVGVLDFGSIKKIDKSRERLLTSEPAYREFNGFEYTDNLAENRIMRKLEKLQAATASAYSRETGYLLWGKDT